MIVVFLLAVIAGTPAAGQILDVCTTCHTNATCDNKPNSSGKVCNCKYGFVGNGRTYCQDKDECQIGASKICGQHTQCHNTYGSYYCTCLSGYSPTNYMATFIPNDGTYCQDIDECKITGLCGQGGWCRNLEGSFECACLLGYQIHNGAEPFHPHRDKASCKVVDCGQPAPVEDTVLLSVTGTTYGNVATYVCDEGFIWASGDNTSVCGANGLWRGPTVVCEEALCGSPPISESTGLVWNGSTAPGSTVLYFCKKGFFNKGGHNVSVCNENGQWTPPALSCQEILCGDPPILPNTEQVWNGSSTPGSTVTYYCKIGFYHSEGNNMSLCTNNASWTKPNISCKDVQCGAPPPVPHSVMLWDKIPTVGSRVVYQCNSRYRSVGERNVSVCTPSGEWDEASLLCQEINCQEPISKPHSKVLWDGTFHIGSVAHYQCYEGYHTRSLKNYSVCGENGLWEDTDLWCEEIRCGPPLILPHTNLLWDHTSRPGSVVLYECMDGYYLESGNNISVCSLSGKWGEISVKCQAKCGPVPFLANSEVVWHNRSVVIHRCMDGYHIWKGSNISVCGSSGVWQKATLRCRDIDECRITGLCGEGGWCRNLEGSFECTCQLGYQVHNGAEPFHPQRDKASCKVVDCGQLAPVEDTVLLSVTGTTYGNVATYVCDEGFIWASGDNTSVCGANGLWRGPTAVCEEINCQQPISKPHSKVLWDGTFHIGSVAHYQCDEGYHTRSLKNYSVCGENGLWEDTDLWCEEISCGPPLILPHTNLLWDHTSRPGSVVLYECMDGYYLESGNNISVCSLSGKWGEISVKCQAKCGPVPFLANSEVVWHNRSVVIYRCMDGYHIWKGSNISVCGSSGVWQKATLRCRVIKPPINHLYVVNEKCVHWKAEKYEEDTEAYKVTYIGTRNYQRSFRDKRKQFLNSKADQLAVCLNLLPATNYNISITALSARFTASITTNTSLPVPPVPVVYYREFETPVPTLRLHRSANTLDPISLYQVFVLPVEEIMVFDCSFPGRPEPISKNKLSGGYITAQILVRHVGTEVNFTVGDGIHYGGFYNAPLENGRNYYIILRAVSQWNTAIKSSCVLWAKIKGTSYVLRVSSLAAASVGLVALAIFSGYSCIWLFKKT
ncbi:sushi domain-containing protein 1 isoform X2 [Scophthalmus maximus]|uniref:sushi domain-containing protein 1 isoform X2 n=1 Tax=Scophthalmus maximus TaxID=52904 RepID=UPI001FA8C869|nr:sushi domain-containing protein 1 isoform X2 [Scophthalmus maximus]